MGALADIPTRAREAWARLGELRPVAEAAGPRWVGVTAACVSLGQELSGALGRPPLPCMAQPVRRFLMPPAQCTEEGTER